MTPTIGSEQSSFNLMVVGTIKTRNIYILEIVLYPDTKVHVFLSKLEQ